MPPNPFRRQPNINDMMYPKGSKQPRQVWAAVMNVYKAPETTPPVTPSQTPTPSITASPTVTPTPTASIGQTPTATETQTPTPTNTPTNTATQTGTPAVTSSPTNTPTQTQTGTPSVTPTNTQTGTPAITPSPTPTAFTGYEYNLVTTPYNPPTSGNTIFPELSVMGATTGLTNPNTFDINGIYWSRIDRTGVDRTSYFSALTATTNYLTFYQGGQSVIYSGSSTAIVNQGPPLTNSFEYNPNARPNQLILIQSAATNFNTSIPVGIKWEEIILPTPSPTPTNTNTPTNTATQTNTPSVTPTNTETPTNTPTNTLTPTNTPTTTTTPTNTPSSTPPAKLLDSYPNAFTAVSTRKLKSDYLGSAVRIIRTSDSTQTDIGFDISGNIDVSAINTFCSGTSCRVRTWYDQSGNGRNFTQAFIGQAPFIYSSGAATTVNGRVSTLFQGSNNMDGPGSGGGSTALASWFTLAYRTGGSTPAYILDFDPNSKIELANTTAIIDNGQTVGTFGTAFNTGLTQSSVLRESGNSKAFINGTQSGPTNTVGLTNLTGSWSIGFGYNRSGGSEFLTGYIGEFVLYISTDQSSNRAGIESNQKGYWGTP